MDLTQFLAVFGAITGALSLVGVVLALGMYKERIDRHERWFNLLVEESLMRAWKSGMIEHQSPFKLKPDVVQSLPSEIQKACQRVASCCGRRCSTREVADRLVGALQRETLNSFCLENGLTPLEAIGTLATHTLELLRKRDTRP